jgi:hypothetical protein
MDGFYKEGPTCLTTLVPVDMVPKINKITQITDTSVYIF